MFISVLQLKDHKNVFHGAANSSNGKLKSVNNHLYSHSFLLSFQRSPDGFFSLTVMPDTSAAAVSPCCWRFSSPARDPSHTTIVQLWEVLPRHLTFSCLRTYFWAQVLPFSAWVTFYEDAMSSLMLPWLWLTWLPAFILHLLHHQGWCGRLKSLSHPCHYPNPTLVASFGYCGTVLSLVACCHWVPLPPLGCQHRFIFPGTTACTFCFLQVSRKTPTRAV